ncbi:serine hydrolase domain-containing protein [Massilia sp. DWR3-1-1]|uniref:serine hydrolase domain-containing protein n=1 Tax=Massilia sp. DWR3-1-1 TaxID=2804559 RepID=UPI003CF66483
MLGLALLGAAHPLLRAAPRAPDGATDRALAAIVADPACQLASLSVLALRAGRPVYQAQFGQRDIGAALPANGATLYRIASVSKLMTTLGLMRLVEGGQLALDADVSTYLGFTLRNPHFADRPISLRALLCHTSSLRDDAGYSWPLSTALSSILVAGAPGFGTGAMWSADAAPGAFFTYCNLGWGVLGTIMERVTGERFDRLMARLLLDPLGIDGGYNPSTLRAASVANIATIYRKRAVDSERWDSAGPWIAQVDDVRRQAPRPPAAIDAYTPGQNATPFSPTGGLRISASSLGVVMQMLMAGGRHGKLRLLQAATLETMFARQWTYDGARPNGATNNGLFQAWGLGNQQFPDAPGQRLIEGGGFNAVGHLGDAYGLRAMFVFDRAAGTGFIVLCGGTASDPDTRTGAHSALAPFEERILAALWQHGMPERTGHA